MSPDWINRLRYWTLALLPACGVFFSGRLLGSEWFALLFLVYLFLYKPALDIRRLLSLGKIEEKDAWKFFIPFAVNRWQYNRSLWLG